MLQVVQNQKNGEMVVEELPAPNCVDGGILVQVSYSLISAGTEKVSVTNAQGSLLERAKKQPDQVKLVIDTVKQHGVVSTYKRVKNKLDSYKSLGYSASGVVIESRTDDFKVGDRVAVAGAGYANHAEIVSIPKNLAVLLPGEVKLEDAAYTTVATIAMQGFRQANPKLGETVAVIGLGLIGQITVQLLKAAGCRVVGLDINEKLFSSAKKYGCDVCYQSSSKEIDRIMSFSRGNGCDSVIITAGTDSNEPLQLAMDICRQKGNVVIVGAVGMDLKRHPFYKKEINLKISCSYGPGRYDSSYEEDGHDYPIAYVRWTENRNMISFIDMLSMGKVDVNSMTSHKFDIKDAPKAYDLITNSEADTYLGVLLEYPDSKPNLKRQIKISDFKKTDNVNISFVGCGQFAQNYLIPPIKKSGAGLYAVSTASSVNSKTAAKVHGFSYGSTDSIDIIRSKESNMVFCASQHDTHSKYVIEAIENKKAVFVEKPLAINQEQLDQIKEGVEKNNGKVMVGFNRRFSPAFQEIKKFFNGRTQPMVISYRINAGMIPKGHWVQSEEHGGRIIGEVCHFIDTVLYLTNASLVSVYAQSITTSDDAVMNADNVIINIKLSDGSLAVIQYLANGDKSLPKEYAEVFCEKATAIMNNFQSLELRRGGKEKNIKLDGKKGINEEVLDTINAVRNGDNMPIDFNTLYDVTRATFLINESLSTGTPIIF